MSLKQILAETVTSPIRLSVRVIWKMCRFGATGRPLKAEERHTTCSMTLSLSDKRKVEVEELRPADTS
jgi:hypothetical protein